MVYFNFVFVALRAAYLVDIYTGKTSQGVLSSLRRMRCLPCLSPLSFCLLACPTTPLAQPVRKSISTKYEGTWRTTFRLQLVQVSCTHRTSVNHCLCGAHTYLLFLAPPALVCVRRLLRCAQHAPSTYIAPWYVRIAYVR